MIRKETKNLGNILIKPVEKELAKEMIIKNHYPHKWNDPSFGKYNYGIFKEEKPDECLGVAWDVKNMTFVFLNYVQKKTWFPVPLAKGL